MPSETRLILQMTRNSILRSKEEVTITEKINWSEVFSIAYRNNIAPFLFDQIMKIEEKSHIDDSVFQKWKQCTMFTSVAEYRKNFALRQIFGEAKKAGIGLILFKGPILANLYPNYALRASCDTDILIKDADKELLFGLVEKLGYHRILVSEDNVYTFESKQYNHRLELHTTLYGQHTGPRIDVLNAMELTKKDSLREMEACGMKVITLGYVEQLIYLMFHMIKHFTLEGISLRHLLDIVLYINAYIDRIDKDIFWSAMQRLGYDSCCIVFFSLGIQYMGLDERILIKRKVSDVKVVNQLLMDIMNHGLVREENKKVFQLWGMMEP